MWRLWTVITSRQVTLLVVSILLRVLAFDAMLSSGNLLAPFTLANCLLQLLHQTADADWCTKRASSQAALFQTIAVIARRQVVAKCLPLNIQHTLNNSIDRTLTLYGQNYFFRRFSRHNLRWALFVYRLIGATLMKIFFWWSLLKIELKFEISVKGDTCILLGVKGLNNAIKGTYPSKMVKFCHFSFYSAIWSLGRGVPLGKKLGSWVH